MDIFRTKQDMTIAMAVSDKPGADQTFPHLRMWENGPSAPELVWVYCPCLRWKPTTEARRHGEHGERRVAGRVDHAFSSLSIPHEKAGAPVILGIEKSINRYMRKSGPPALLQRVRRVLLVTGAIRITVPHPPTKFRCGVPVLRFHPLGIDLCVRSKSSIPDDFPLPALLLPSLFPG